MSRTSKQRRKFGMKATALYTALETVKEDEALVTTFTLTLSTCQGPNASVSASNWGRKAPIKRGTTGRRRRKAKSSQMSAVPRALAPVTEVSELMRSLWRAIVASARNELTFLLNQLVKEMNKGPYEIIPRRLTTIDTFLRWHLPTEVVTPFMGRLDENNGAAQVLLEIDFLRDSESEDTSLGSPGILVEVNFQGGGDTVSSLDATSGSQGVVGEVNPHGNGAAMSLDNSTGSGSQSVLIPVTEVSELMRSLWRAIGASARNELTFHLNRLVEEMNKGPYEIIPRRLTMIGTFLHGYLPTEVVTPFMGRLDEDNGAARALLEIDFVRDSESEDTSLGSPGVLVEVNHQGNADAISVDSYTGSGSQGAVAMECSSAADSDSQDGRTSDAEMIDESASTSDEVPRNE